MKATITIKVDVENKKIESVEGMEGLDPIQGSIVLQQISLQCLSMVKVEKKPGQVEVITPKIIV